MIELQPAVSALFNRLQMDEMWQKNLDADERRILLDAALEFLLLSNSHGWDMEREYSKILSMCRAYAWLKICSSDESVRCAWDASRGETVLVKAGSQAGVIEK